MHEMQGTGAPRGVVPHDGSCLKHPSSKKRGLFPFFLSGQDVVGEKFRTELHAGCSFAVLYRLRA